MRVSGRYVLCLTPHMLHPLLLASCALHHLCTQDHNQLSNARFPSPPPQGSRYVVALPCAIRPCSWLTSWCVVRRSATFLQRMRAFWFHICSFLSTYCINARSRPLLSSQAPPCLSLIYIHMIHSHRGGRGGGQSGAPASGGV